MRLWDPFYLLGDYENVRRIVKSIGIEYNHSTFFKNYFDNKRKNSINIVALYNVMASKYIVNFRLDLMASK